MGSGRLENDYAIGRDTTLLPLGEPAYRFELRSGDNTIEGLFPGQKVARAELSYCYAVASDYKNETSFEQARRRKTVHYSGKGACSQGAHMEYVSVYLCPVVWNRMRMSFCPMAWNAYAYPYCRY